MFKYTLNIYPNYTQIYINLPRNTLPHQVGWPRRVEGWCRLVPTSRTTPTYTQAYGGPMWMCGRLDMWTLPYAGVHLFLHDLEHCLNGVSRSGWLHWISLCLLRITTSGSRPSFSKLPRLSRFHAKCHVYVILWHIKYILGHAKVGLSHTPAICQVLRSADMLKSVTSSVVFPFGCPVIPDKKVHGYLNFGGASRRWMARWRMITCQSYLNRITVISPFIFDFNMSL